MEKKACVSMWKPANVSEQTDWPADLLQAPDPQPAMSAPSEPAVHLPSRGHPDSVPATPLLGAAFVFVMIQLYQRRKTTVARTRQFTSLAYDSYHRSNPKCLQCSGPTLLLFCCSSPQHTASTLWFVSSSYLHASIPDSWNKGEMSPSLLRAWSRRCT